MLALGLPVLLVAKVDLDLRVAGCGPSRSRAGVVLSRDWPPFTK